MHDRHTHKLDINKIGLPAWPGGANTAPPPPMIHIVKFSLNTAKCIDTSCGAYANPSLYKVATLSNGSSTLTSTFAWFRPSEYSWYASQLRREQLLRSLSVTSLSTYGCFTPTSHTASNGALVFTPFLPRYRPISVPGMRCCIWYSGICE
ncbi:hypothetical protein BDQ17DRAFT_278079 [Cyathus striatus]|nr:hypothetical protein BDQ17DRAFT_278079 [Cyathus striatus]